MNTNFIFQLLMKEIKFKVDESIQLKPIIRDGTKERGGLAYRQTTGRTYRIPDERVGRRTDPP